MEISASQVKELRERTGSGMMECKKALVEAKGDIEAAIELMRKSGQAKADKKSGRVAAEGLIVIRLSSDAKQAALLEINCETDFVARDNNFTDFANQVAELALTHQLDNTEALAELPYDATGAQTVEQVRHGLVAKIGENINIRRISFIDHQEPLGVYSHGGRIGVVVALKGGDEELRKDLAMHIAANNPIVISPEQVAADVVAKEREIYFAQAETSGKPKEIVEKMVEGKIKKFLADSSLLGQPFVKDPGVQVAELLQRKQAQVISFTRLAVGEGIEKPMVNFAEEVMSQIKGS